MSVEGIPLVNPDLYSETYYDEPPSDNTTLTEAYGRIQDTISPFHRAIFVFLLRAGLLLIQLGSIPVKDTNLILLHNVFEFAVASISYAIVGYVFAFGIDAGQLIGRGRWISSYDASMDDAVAGWSAVITATGIFTTMVAGRLHLVSFVVVVFLMAAVVDPLAIHWIWTPDGFMHDYDLHDEAVSFRDMGGCAIVHVFAGTVALIAVFALGRRLLRLRDINESSLPASSPATCFLGYFLLIIGLHALSLPNIFYEDQHGADYYVGRIMINNILAMSGGMLVVCLIQFAMEKDTFNYWTMLRCAQGAIAGMVVISAGADAYTPVIALLLGMGAGTVFYFVARVLFNTPAEDYCNIVPIHFVCGLIGTLMPPMFGDTPGFAFDKNAALRTVTLNLCWQAMCDGILLLLFFVVFLPVFLLLYCLGVVHNRSDEVDHMRAKTVLARGPDRSLMQRLFKPADPPRLITPGNASKDEKRQRGLDSPSSRIHMSYFQPRSLGGNTTSFNDTTQPIMAYRAEVETSRPPLGDYFNPRDDGDKHSDTKISNDGKSESGRSVEYGVQNSPHGEPGVSSPSKYDPESNKPVRPGGDNVNSEYDNWQTVAQRSQGTRSLEGDLNVHRETEKVQAFNYNPTTKNEVGYRSKDVQSGQTQHRDARNVHRQYAAGINASQSERNVPVGNIPNSERAYASDDRLELLNTRLSECRIQIDDDTEPEGDVTSDERFQTVYMRGVVDTGSTEEVLNSGCIDAQFRYKYADTGGVDSSGANLSNVHQLGGASSENATHLTQSSRLLVEHRNRHSEPRATPSHGNTQGEYRFGVRESSQTGNDYASRYTSRSDYTLSSSRTFSTISSEPNENSSDAIQNVDGVNTLNGGGAPYIRFEPHDKTYAGQIPEYDYSLRCGSDGLLTPSGVSLGPDESSEYIFSFREREEKEEGGERGKKAQCVRSGEVAEGPLRTARRLSLSVVARKLGGKRGGQPTLKQTARRACKKRDRRELQFTLRGRSTSQTASSGRAVEAVASYSEPEDGTDRSAHSLHSEGSDGGNSSNLLVGAGTKDSATASNQREVLSRGAKKAFHRVVDELCTRFPNSPGRSQHQRFDGSRPSPSHPCFNHNRLAVRQQQLMSPKRQSHVLGLDAMRDATGVRGVVTASSRGPRTPSTPRRTHNPMRMDRDENSDIVIVVDPDEEAKQEEQFNNLNKWFE